jgi:hypothetical protein
MKVAGTDFIPVTSAISLQFSSMVCSRLPIAGILQYDFCNSTYLLHVPTLHDRSDGEVCSNIESGREWQCTSISSALWMSGITGEAKKDTDCWQRLHAVPEFRTKSGPL